MAASTRIIVVFPDNSVQINGWDYAHGTRQSQYVIDRYGIELVRATDTRHRESDGTLIKLYATGKKHGGWSKRIKKEKQRSESINA